MALIGNGASSAIVSSQLVPVARPDAIWPAPALQPIMGQGAFPANLPGVGNQIGGATSGTTAAITGQTGGAQSAEGGIAGVAANFSALPLWKQPVVLVMVMLVLGYLMLKHIHWDT